ncbi:MAG: peptidoglycan DD-metalloendopeptidase family protein [Desulfobacterales bacterium]|nr:peptidoglycan DD-metalloendopeptidase family protein [Desulfobacterales bacterium]
MTPAPLTGSEAVGTGIIAASKLNMRSAPDPAAPILMVLNRDAKIKILRQDKEWLHIIHNDTVGYVRNRKRYVEILPAGQEKTANDEKSFQPATDKKAPFQSASKEILQQLSEHRQEVVTFTKKEVALVESLNDIDLSIDSSRKQVAALRSEARILDEKIKENAAASKALIIKMDRIEAYAAKRLVALYKLNWLGRFNVLVSAESMYDLFQRKSALEKILTYDDNIRQELSSSKTRLEHLQAQLQDEKNTKRSLEETIQKQIGMMSLKRSERTVLLDEIRNKKSMELAAIEALRQSALALDQKVRSLSTTEKRPLREEKVPPKSFNELKGLLKIPVKGTITTSFGSYLNTKLNVLNFRSGIDIKTDRGEPIRAVSAGIIIYASWFKGYGNMIIIDHGNSYYTVYAHVEEFFKTKGEVVESDEVIATAGDTGSMIGSGLYFEVRHHGKPQDPMEWIKRG